MGGDTKGKVRTGGGEACDSLVLPVTRGYICVLQGSLVEEPFPTDTNYIPSISFLAIPVTFSSLSLDSYISVGSVHGQEIMPPQKALVTGA